MEFKVTPPVVALQVRDNKTLALLLRSYPAPSSAEEA